MSESVLARYGPVTIYMEAGHPSPMYHYDGQATDNPYGELAILLEDDQLEEVMYNGGAQCVKVAHRNYGICRTNVWMSDDEGVQVAKNIAAFTNVPLGNGPGLVPLFDGRLPDGSRVNGTLPPISPDGPTLTIRKFREDPITIIDLINWGTINSRLAAMMWVWVEGLNARPANFVIAGGTGSGKTTTLNCLGMFIPWDKRLLTVEDTAELQVYHDHWLRMETRQERPDGTSAISMDDCLKSSLRMRPDRIIVGEVRGGEALDMLQAMNTGHDGSMGTVHANNPREALSRVENMIAMGGFNLPAKAMREQIASAINVVVQAARLRDGSRKITHVTEVIGMEGDVVTMQDLFVFEIEGEDAERLQSFTGDLNTFVHATLQYITFNTDEKPFPFCDWPAPDKVDDAPNYY